MRITFVSNYINHHQIPFCEEMIKRLSPDDSFTFIQTEEMEDDRKNMGWNEAMPEYVLAAYESPEINERARKLISDSEIVIFGGCEDESYIFPRLSSGEDRLTLRYSERVYKDGQWKFVTPKGLIKKYGDHTKYNKKPVYLLCAGAYVASDFSLFGAYKGKMMKWGYFPEIRHYEPEKLLKEKGYETGGKKVPYILWTGRFLDWKRPHLAVLTARYLKDKNREFHMDMIGDGPEKERITGLISNYGLEDVITASGFKAPEEIRRYMEKADIYLFTSDRREGWGAVANEAMNSCCALVAGSMIGAVPYLLKNKKNGMVFNDKSPEDLFDKTELLLKDSELRNELALKAYETVSGLWNPGVAAERLMGIIRAFEEGEKFPVYDEGPCSIEMPMSEKKINNNALLSEYRLS